MGVSAKKAVVCSLMILLLALAGCPSNKIVFPAITEDAAQIQRPGKFVWFDLFSTDMTSCENFYEALFGWDFQRTNDYNPRVKTIFYQSKPIANMIGRESKPGDSQWLSYMSTENVETTLEMVVDGGGTVFRKAHDLPNRGREAAVIDPQGAAFALLDSPIGDPSDAALQPNVWLGSELWTTDVDGAARFYTFVAGYEVKAIQVHDKVQYRLLRKNGKRRGGIVSIPWKNMQPEWVPYIAVENVPAVVAQVEALGGKILIAPDMSVKEGRLAMIVDPSGAVFGIHQIR